MSEEQMDLMIPLRPKGSRWGDNELRYCLRSFEQHLPNLGKVWIVGHKPDWLTGVEHIPCRHEKGWYKDARMMQRVLLACRAGISETFLRASDDQTLLRPPKPGELVARYVTHSRKTSNWPRSHPVWYNRFANTIAKLKTSRCYDIHIPQPYRRDAVATLLETTDLHVRPGLAINTWILGQTADETAEGIPCGLWYSYVKPTADVRQFLAKHFPTPSRFEGPIMVPATTAVPKGAVTVALLTCDRRDYTQRTVDSLLKHHPPGTLRLYHADDASTDPEVCQYVQSRGFETIVANTTRLGCSPTTELLMRAVAERVEPGSIVVYLQNDFDCYRPLPVKQLTQLLDQPDVEHVQLSYRRPRNAYNKATIWKTKDGRLWPFGDQNIAPVVYGGFGRGVGYHPSAATIETWVRNTTGVRQEPNLVARSSQPTKQACRLTTPVFGHNGRRRTPNGKFGRRMARGSQQLGMASYPTGTKRNARQAGATLCRRIAELVKPGMRTLECGSGVTTWLFYSLATAHTALEHEVKYAPPLPTVRICPLVGNPPWYNWRPGVEPYDVIVIDGPPGKIGRRGILPHLNRLVRTGTVLLIDDTNRAVDAAFAAEVAATLGAMMQDRPAEHKYDFGKQFTEVVVP